MAKNDEAIQVKLHRFDSCIANRKGKAPVFDGRLSEEAAEFLFLLLAGNAQKNAYYQQDHTDHNEDGAGIGGAAADQAVELSLQAVVLHKAKTGADTPATAKMIPRINMLILLSLFSLYGFTQCHGQSPSDGLSHTNSII